jgi:hypothetical protein
MRNPKWLAGAMYTGLYLSLTSKRHISISFCRSAHLFPWIKYGISTVDFLIITTCWFEDSSCIAQQGTDIRVVLIVPSVIYTLIILFSLFNDDSPPGLYKTLIDSES